MQEDNTGHPLKDNQEAMRLIKNIESHADALIKNLVGPFQTNTDMWTTDLLVFGAAKRTLSLCKGFTTMIRDRNFGVAASLLRLQLDSALRFSGLFHVTGPEEYARNILAGMRTSKMRARDGKKMTDAYLIEKMAQRFPWLQAVYENTSGFIHLSDRHIFQVIHSFRDEDRSFSIAVSAEDVPRPTEAYVEILAAFEAATILISTILVDWAKKRPRLKKSP
jgi:hypothetical protein